MEFFPRVVFYLKFLDYKVPVTETVVVTWCVMVILMVFSYFAGKSVGKKDGVLQKVCEAFYEGMENILVETMGESASAFIPYIGTLLAFLLFSNLSGLFGARPPTADLSTTLMLASITFFLTQKEGIRRKGLLGYIKSFFEPSPVLFPLNVIGSFSTPVSMAFRLFGNILGGLIIMNLVYSAVPLFIPVPLHFYFDIFAEILQAFIFVMLTAVFIAMAD
ncbi:MAG: F-type H+-transporting ATPase subunit a [Tepidanaerobacteraceae bacterium]|nr:F-type H+-transporting ATPase subunit a [Tepidanaerobacteraceae bacterium]